MPSVRRKSREVAGPTTVSKTKLKRIARFLNGCQRCVLNFPWVGKPDDVTHVIADADWAGEPKMRCFMSGGVSAFGLCFTVRHCSVTQATVSLSSEAKAMTKGCVEALYVKHLLEHQTSPGGGKNTWRCRRYGFNSGKDRSHLVEQIEYAGNVADLLMKHVPRAVLDKLAGMMAYKFLGEETAVLSRHTSKGGSGATVELATKNRSVDLNKSTQKAIHHKTRWR